jgi:hypothetical protein
MDPVHREIAPALLRAPDELAPQPGPGRLRRHRLGLEDVNVGDRALDGAAVSDVDIFEAKSVPPQTTRARLRGEFIRRAQERRRDFTVDWVHLKLNDQAQRTVLCKDPFRSVDERVEKLIAGM